MSRPAPSNTSFQITISKSVLENIDGMLVAVNDLLTKEGQKNLTRSQWIEKILENFIVSVSMSTEEIKKAREEMEDKEKC